LIPAPQPVDGESRIANLATAFTRGVVVRRILSVAIIAAVMMFVFGFAAVRAQSNLDAGKSAEQIFADTCAMCHATPHALRTVSQQFLRQHYTTGARQAAALAAYLEKALKEPPPPPAPAVQAAAKSRRPSPSIEIGLPSDTSARAVSASTETALQDSAAFEE
jgi:hypothetical protein